MYKVSGHMHAGYSYEEQGIKSCAVNTSATVGTIFTITFMVFDYSISSLNASVTRTISIIDPCDTGEYLCSDGTCSTIACDLRSALTQHTPPVLLVIAAYISMYYSHQSSPHTWL